MAEPTLYIVPTPIGNLRDITLRALDILQQVDLIACEDTRHTLKLLTHFGIRKQLISYEKFSEVKRAAYLIRHLESGKSIALVSDAGTPMVSDPGCVMIAKVRDKGIRIEALPGPSAIIAAQSASGFEGSFRFIGFFPRHQASINRELSRMLVSQENTIFFESPRRIGKTLTSINKVLGGRVICLAREISKIHEEYIVGSALEVYDNLKQLDSIGEITVVIKGIDQSDDIDETLMLMRARELLKSGCSKKDILHILSQETGRKRNEIYEMLLKMD